MKYTFLAIGILCLIAASVGKANTAPEPQGFGFMLPNESALPGESVNFDISVHFSDPDGDDLDYFITEWSDPLPAGLSLDSETGVITGEFQGYDNKIASSAFIYAQDPSGAQSGNRGFVLWQPVSHGPVADLFYRTCNPDLFDCIPGYNYQVQPRGNILDFNPEGASATAVFPVPPTEEATRMSASVGYDSGELTPAISTFLRPGDERMTGNQLGISRHVQTGDVTIEGTLTYSQTGGVWGPDPSPPPEDLPFGAVGHATLFSYQLVPEANGLLDGSLCDWSSGQGGSMRSLIHCVKNGGHPAVTHLQIETFPLPSIGNEVQGDGTVTPALVDGVASASLFVPYEGPPDPELYIGLELFTIARYGGEADSQHTLLVSFDDPEVMEPNMEGVTEPSFVPAPESGGTFEVSINQGMCININSHGRIPVVIFGDEEIAATAIDPTSVSLGAFPLAARGHDQVACSVEDVDLDLYDDLTCQFLDDGSSLPGAPGAVTVTFSFQGEFETYYGQDEVCLE